MPLGRPKRDEADTMHWLEVDASMTGTMTFKDPVNLRINGQFDGTLDIKGNLSIGEKAQVKATIQGESIIIAGSVKGSITATDRVELTSSARVIGKVSCGRVIMQDGAILHGTLEMDNSGSNEKWISATELAKYLEVDADTVVKWAKEGRLPAKQNGSQWQFDRAKVEDWLAKEKVK